MRRLRTWCTALVLVFLGACELKGTTVVDVCEAEGQRCRLRDGLLGICGVDLTASCQDGPCYRCVGQH